MKIIKFIILVLIFLTSLYIGLLLSKKYSKRELELKEFKKILNALKTKIKFTYEPLADIFYDISQSNIKSISELLKNIIVKMENMHVSNAWNEAIEESNLNINDEDKNIIKGLGKMLR